MNEGMTLHCRYPLGSIPPFSTKHEAVCPTKRSDVEGRAFRERRELDALVFSKARLPASKRSEIIWMDLRFSQQSWMDIG